MVALNYPPVIINSPDIGLQRGLVVLERHQLHWGKIFKLKQMLAEKFATNQKAYTSGKSEFIQKVLQDARVDSAVIACILFPW